MNYIIGLVGPSGSGKSTLILEALKILGPTATILKSTTTRPKRSPEDELFYSFITEQEFLKRSTDGLVANVSQYAGNYYGYEKNMIQSALAVGHSFCAIIESAVLELKTLSYPIKVVRIIPENQKVFRGEVRKSEDINRSQIKIPIEIEIVNSFDTGGRETAVEKIVEFVNNLG